MLFVNGQPLYGRIASEAKVQESMASLNNRQSTVQLRDLSLQKLPVARISELQHDFEKEDADENLTRVGSILPPSQLASKLELQLKGRLQPTPTRRPSNAVIGHSSRLTTCGRVVNFFDFLLSYLSQAATFGYLVLFDFDEVSPSLRFVIVAFICLRFLLAVLGSVAIYRGLRHELA